MTDRGAITGASARRGGLAALSAYGLWGLVPLYFRALAEVGADEIVAQRVLWTVVLLLLVLVLSRDRSGWSALRTRPARLFGLLCSSACITSNWLIFVWAVNAGRVLDTSLGYYINPLVTMLLAMVFFGERLRRPQWVALALAAAGVASQVWQLGQLPWVSLLLALTFAAYTLLRKQIAIDAISGLFVETLFALPAAVIFLVWAAAQGTLAFGSRGTTTDLLLVASGAVTALPLVLFAYGARRVTLVTVGFMQYVAPSLTFLLAVAWFGEAFDGPRMLSFGLIWAGLAVYSLDLLRRTSPAAGRPGEKSGRETPGAGSGAP